MNSTEIDNLDPPNAAILGSHPADAPENGSGSSVSRPDDASAAGIDGPGLRHGNVPFHPIANVFRLTEGQEFDDLVISIKENGLLEPITMFEDKILDGRNRFRACLQLGIEPTTVPFVGDDPVGFVVAKNIFRRHLNAIQRAMLVEKFATLSPGHPRDSEKTVAERLISGPSRQRLSEVAAMVNVGERTVKLAHVISKHGTRHEIEAVETGIHSAKTIARRVKERLPVPRNKKLSDRERISREDTHEHIFRTFATAVVNFSLLGRPADVAPIIRKRDMEGWVDARLAEFVRWINEFSDAWESSRNCNDGLDTTDGGVPGKPATNSAEQETSQ